MRPFTILASACLCFGLSSGSAFASITLVQATGSNYVYSVTHPTEPWVVFVDPADEVTYQSSASQDMRTALAAEFSGWSFSYYGGLSGTMTINYYKAAIDGDLGGAMISATYQPDAEDPPNLSLIQLVTTDDPLNHPSSPYMDVLANATTPFYPYVESDPQTGTISFYDFSRRLGPTDPFTGKSWRGELLLVSWPGGSSTDVSVYDGILWGWGMYRGVGILNVAASPMPEPSTLAFVFIGVASLAIVKRRNLSSQHQAGGQVIPLRRQTPAYGVILFLLLAPTCLVAQATDVSEPSKKPRAPQVYKDVKSGVLFYVESDGRHVSAIHPEGRVLWHRDPFAESGLKPYRVARPVIVYIGPASRRALEELKGKGNFIGIDFDSSQFGVLNAATGEFLFRGQD